VEHSADARTERDEPTLAELGVADDEELAAEVDVGAPQARHLPYAKSEAV
jgi:hypothetical protein